MFPWGLTGIATYKGPRRRYRGPQLCEHTDHAFFKSPIFNAHTDVQNDKNADIPKDQTSKNPSVFQFPWGVPVNSKITTAGFSRHQKSLEKQRFFKVFQIAWFGTGGAKSNKWRDQKTWHFSRESPPGSGFSMFFRLSVCALEIGLFFELKMSIFFSFSLESELWSHEQRGAFGASRVPAPCFRGLFSPCFHEGWRALPPTRAPHAKTGPKR